MFKVGQKVVVLQSYIGAFHTIVKGEVYEVGRLYTDSLGLNLCLKGYGSPWIKPHEFFAPIKSAKSAIKDLCNINIVTETSDAPMKNPSPMKPMRELETA